MAEVPCEQRVSGKARAANRDAACRATGVPRRVAVMPRALHRAGAAGRRRVGAVEHCTHLARESEHCTHLAQAMKCANDQPYSSVETARGLKRAETFLASTTVTPNASAAERAPPPEPQRHCGAQ